MPEKAVFCHVTPGHELNEMNGLVVTIALCCHVGSNGNESANRLFTVLTAVIIIIEPDNVVFAKVLATLDLNYC